MKVSRYMARQYANPTGLFGRFITAPLLNRANRQSNTRVLEVLDIQPGSSILEVGFGGADLLANIAAKFPEASVCGVENSRDMLARARKILDQYSTAGRTALATGIASDLPFGNAQFDRVCSVNTIYFWESLDTSFIELARVTRTNGTLVLGFGTSSALRQAGYEEQGFNLYSIESILAALTQHGFDLVDHIEIERTSRGTFNILKCRRRPGKIQKQEIGTTQPLIHIDDELQIHVRESGKGDTPVVLVPGWTMSTEVFERQLRFFENSERYRMVTFDPRAHGQSSTPPTGHTYDQHGRDLHQLLEKLNLNNVVLGGWSFGTLAALSYIHQYGSSRLRGLVMIDGPPRAMGHSSLAQWFTYPTNDLNGDYAFFNTQRTRNHDDAVEKFARWMLEDESEQNIRWIRDITLRMPDAAASELNGTSLFCNYESDLIALDGKLPLLYVMRHSRGDAVKNWSRAHTPSATVVAFGEHMMFWERADVFNDVLKDFLQTT